MTQEATLLQAISAAPVDDAPRLAYAKWLAAEGQADRSKFIQLQLKMAKLEAEDPKFGRLADQQWNLLTPHQNEWSNKLTAQGITCTFERGFVNRVFPAPEQFLKHAKQIAALGTVEHVEFQREQGWKDTEKMLARLAACPQLQRIPSIGLSFAYGEMTNAGMKTLATLTPLVERLGGFGLHDCKVNRAGLRHLLKSPQLGRLRSLAFDSMSKLAEQEVQVLADCPSCARLDYLNFSRCGLSDPGVEILAGSPHLTVLRELHLCEYEKLGDGSARALAQSPHLSQLRQLHLTGNLTDAGAVALLTSPQLGNLRQLWLYGEGIGDESLRALVSEPCLPQLRMVSLTGGPLTDAGAELLLGSARMKEFTLIELNGSNLSGPMRKALKSRFKKAIVC